MKKIRRKIVLACTAVMMLLLTTVTTTFAWFSLNESAWLEGMELEVNNMDNLLITAGYDANVENMKFKQYLTAEDIVAAINAKRSVGDEITSLSEIKLAPVTTTDGQNFEQTVVSYDEMNKQSVDFETADTNSYISMRISFTVENNADTQEFKLYFATLADEVDGITQTTFAADDQTITLVNDLNNNGTEMKPGETLTVNPVNALRMSVTDINVASTTYIYDLGNEQETNANYSKNLGDLANAANADTNAMLTYYNNINVADLDPMEDYASNVVVRTNFDDALGSFTNVGGTQYSIVTLDINIWIEGYDADSIVGLDTSVITMLLTFGANIK